jgi:aryl-alcohol dehydrogenase-like predicted oxidoreductase
MEQRLLGRTGVSVSSLCLGAMMFGDWGNKDHDDSIQIIHRALDAGINFIDTADIYSQGESEVIVGKALADGRRDDVVLATKAWGKMGDDVNQGGVSRRWITKEVEDSLRRLKTDWIDLYQIHRYEPNVDIDETLGTLPTSSTKGRSATSAPRPSRPRRSWKHSASHGSATSSATSVSNRPTRCSPAASRPTYCPPASATGWG